MDKILGLRPSSNFQTAFEVRIYFFGLAHQARKLLLELKLRVAFFFLHGRSRHAQRFFDALSLL